MPTRTRRYQRRHTVKASLQVPGLTKAGSSLELELFADDATLGRIRLGRGALYWQGSYGRTEKRISWTRFTAMMNNLAYPRRRSHTAK